VNLPLVHLPEAEDDILSTFRHYQRERSGLGGEFIVELRKTLAKIAERPKSFALYSRQVRTALLARFPYVVYFRLYSDRITVVAVQHGRRSSKAWKGRI
jgi:plasmid stabilization system protein ParE